MKIDKEFEQLIPPLAEEEYKRLEASIVKEGCRDALVLWDDTLVDGHNRYRICQEHDIAFQTVRRDFADRNAVKLWMLNNQLGRRNLNDFQRVEMVRKCEDAVKARAKERQAKYYGNQYESGLEVKLPQVQNTEPSLKSSKEEANPQKTESTDERHTEKLKVDTILSGCKVEANALEQNKASSEDTKKPLRHLQVRDELGKMAGVSGSTYERATAVLDNAPKEVIQAVRNGEMSINKAYQHVKRVEKEAKREEARQQNAEKIKTISSPLETQGLFQTIVIDPAWDYSEEGDNDAFGRIKPSYQTMPMKEIEALPIARISDKNCHLYIWVTNRTLQKAFHLVEIWGFRYITCLTWIKPHFGVGNYYRSQTEHVLFGVKGQQPLKRHDVGTWFEAPCGQHSEKPDEFYKLV